MAKKNLRKPPAKLLQQQRNRRPQQQQLNNNNNRPVFTNFAQLEQHVLERREMFDLDHCIQQLNRYIDSNINKSKQDMVNALDLLAEIYIDSGNSASALSCFEKSAQLDPTNYSKFMNLGQLYALEPPTTLTMTIETNKTFQCYNKGIELMKQAVVRRPQDETLKNELSMAYCAVAELFMTDLCDVPDAEHRCHDALKNADLYAPENPHVLQDWASFLITTHKNDLALQKLERVANQILSCDPTLVMQSFPYDFQIATCRMLIELDKFAVAKPILELLLSHYDECADVWYMLGHVMNAEGNTEGYRKYLIKAIQLANGDMFESEIKNELTDKFGPNYMQGIDLKKVDDVLDDDEEGGEDDGNWEDVDSDSDEEMDEQ